MLVPDVAARELLAEPGIGSVELAVYFVAWTSYPDCMTDLSRMVRAARSTTAHACAALEARGWLTLLADGKRVRPVALIPDRCQAHMVQSLETAYELAANRGEFLMKRYLDLRISSDEYVDNARPEFLCNPGTGELLEYDRLYLQGVAFEFNGPQHYVSTRRFPSERDLRQTQARDLIKCGASHKARVVLVEVTADELYLDILETLIPDQLPRRQVDVNGQYYRALAAMCAGYAAKARSGKG
ncbi:MAG: hypothetical protein Q8P31_04720 [Bacillota bacterium]|nr:hypothetical protein [Bacillota bacterium]